jgi:hypothetical protein
MIGRMNPSSSERSLDQLALHRLCGDDLSVRVMLLEPAAVAHQRAASAGPPMTVTSSARRDLLRSALVVGAGYFVAVLVGHGTGVALSHPSASSTAPFEPLPLVDDLGAVHAQELGAPR